MTKSKLILQSSLAILMLLIAASLCAAAEDMGLITGGDKGTYYQFGLDLQKLTKPTGVNLTVHTSKGSIEKDRKSTRLNSSHTMTSRMPSSA